MTINIREAERNDCKALAEISKQAFTQPMSENEFGRELDTAFSKTLIAETGGDIVGYINIWLISGEADLNNIAVIPKYRRLGVGQVLLSEGIKKCEGCSVITLEVRPSNTAAVAFYEKNGFKLVGYRKAFYEKPMEDAAMYKKVLVK